MLEAQKQFGSGKPKSESEEPKVSQSNIPVGDKSAILANLETYENLKIINDSLLFLISSKENVSGLEGADSFSSKVRDGVIFDSILTAISFPGKEIDSKILEINKKLESLSKEKKGIRNSADKIDDLIGIYRGVGTVDVLIFGLAMFLVEEDVLIGMLSSKGYENLKLVKGLYSKDFFDSLEQKLKINMVIIVMIFKQDHYLSFQELRQIYINMYKVKSGQKYSFYWHINCGSIYYLLYFY